MQLDIVLLATAGSSTAVDSLDPIFNDLFTSFGGNNCYFACNVGSEFFQRSQFVGRNQRNMSRRFKSHERDGQLIGPFAEISHLINLFFNSLVILILYG